MLSCYEKENPEYLEQCLLSIQQQSLKANEIIIVEDGPLTVRLYNILDAFENLLPLKRVKIADNLGLGNALKIGLNHCSNEIVLRMDTDDICFKDRFYNQLDFFEKNPKVDIVGGWAIDIDESGNEIGKRRVPLGHDKIYKSIWACPIIHPAVGFKKSSIERIGSYNTSISRRQDYELWMRAANEGLIFSNINKFLIYYRFTDNYFKKNNSKVAFFQAKLGLKGLFRLKSKSIFAYIGVFIPYLRSLLPVKWAKFFQKKMSRFDPRKSIPTNEF